MIETTHTETVSGPVKHLELVTSHGIIRCPVRIVRNPRVELPACELDDYNRFVYALPGGGSICA